MEGHAVTRGQLERRFGEHEAPTPQVETKLAEVRALLLETADKLVELTGASSREQSTMLTKLEECEMWALGDILRKGAEGVGAHSL